MEGIIINKTKFTLISELKSSILSSSINQRRHVYKVFYIIIITIIFGAENRKVYASIQLDSNNNQKIEEIMGNVDQVAANEKVEFFSVDNNTYKITEDDENIVMFWKHENIDNSESIIINNDVKYNGKDFKVKYIYEKAFDNMDVNVTNISIGNSILGFCDLNGNLIKVLYGAFKDHQKIQTIDFGNNNFIFGPNYFQNCASIQTVEVPKSMNIMEGYCFDKCYSLRYLDLSGITKFDGQNCFANCIKLDNIKELNNVLTELPDRTFTGCCNLKINSLNNITKVGDECFKSCILLNEKIVTNIEEIGSQCFVGCNFKEIYLKNAKKIGNSAFSKIVNLKKVRFGNIEIPDFEKNIVEGSSVNEWIYPENYKTQPNYLEFLNKLSLSKVIWNPNCEKLASKVTQGVRLDSLKPPTITRDGYEIEGWYKEPEYINKINMIADLGDVVESDVVIKNPVLYAKWIEKEPEKPEAPEEPSDTNEPEKPLVPEEPSDTKEPEKPEAPEEPSDTKEPEKPQDPKEPSDTKEPEKPEVPEEPSGTKEPEKPEVPEEPSGTKEPEKPEVPEEPSGTKEPDKPEVPGESSGTKEPEKPEAPEEPSGTKEPEKPEASDESNVDKHSSNRHKESRKTKNDIVDFIIKNRGENKDISIKESDDVYLENKFIKDIFNSLTAEKNVLIKGLNWSYLDRGKNNEEVLQSGTISKINNNNNVIGIYLKGNDNLKNNTVIEVNIKDFIKPVRLYSYKAELGKFILIGEDLQNNKNKIKLKLTNKKEYLITNLKLDEDNIANKGWNKISPQQTKMLIGENINELSWIYIKGQELAKGWVEDPKDGKWYFMNDKGIMKTGWLKDEDDNVYYLNTISDGSKGAMKVGWNKIDNEWYYLKNNGVLAINTIVEGYAIGGDGKLI